MRVLRRGCGHLHDSKANALLLSSSVLQLGCCIDCLCPRGGEIETSCGLQDSHRARLATPGSGPHTVLVGVSPIGDIQGLWGGCEPVVGRKQGGGGQEGAWRFSSKESQESRLPACDSRLISLPGPKPASPFFFSALAPSTSHPTLPHSGASTPCSREEAQGDASWLPGHWGRRPGRSQDPREKGET